MAQEIKRVPSDDAPSPLVGDVDPAEGHRREHAERDEDIIRLLREKLQDRDPRNTDVTLPPRRKRVSAEDEDKYEPQRISRKICWQYDSTAHKVPLLRRHYI